MQTFARRLLIGVALLSFCANISFAQTGKTPISDRELLALIAGNALSENIVHEIETRGLGFLSSDQFRALAKDAGADARVMTALNNAKPRDSSTPAKGDLNDPLLQHLAKAGNLLQDKKYADATRELSAAMEAGGGAETGFVMAEILRAEEDWTSAAIVLTEAQRQSPDFPEIHTKLSYALYRARDGETALSEARIALTANPNNAEAHKNAGLALQSLEKFNASELEYREALRLKPDYAPARLDFGILFFNEKKYDLAIEQYKKAIALNLADGDVHFNLALSFHAKGDLGSAIREYREAIRLKPTEYLFRDRLGHALMAASGTIPDALKVFRETEAMWPENADCHKDTANALLAMDNLDEAEKEFRKTIELDPTESAAYEGLGQIRQRQKDYDAALQEFRQAEKLDPTESQPYADAGTVLLLKKDFSEATKELKRAEAVAPSNSYVHDLLGQSLTSSGDTAGAISEFKQAVALDPKRNSVRLELASALETHGDLSRQQEAAEFDRRAESIRSASGAPAGGPMAQLPK